MCREMCSEMSSEMSSEMCREMSNEVKRESKIQSDNEFIKMIGNHAEHLLNREQKVVEAGVVPKLEVRCQDFFDKVFDQVKQDWDKKAAQPEGIVWIKDPSGRRSPQSECQTNDDKTLMSDLVEFLDWSEFQIVEFLAAALHAELSKTYKQVPYIVLKTDGGLVMGGKISYCFMSIH